METSTQSKEVWVLLFLYRSPSSYFPTPTEPLGLPSFVQSHPSIPWSNFWSDSILWGPCPIPVFQILSTSQSPSLYCHCLLGSHKRISLPTLQSLCPSGAHICLSWMVLIPLQHCNQSPGSSAQSCMQGHYWMPFFHPLLTTPSRGPTSSSKADSRASDLLLLWTCSAPSPQLFQPLYPGN